MVIQSRGRTTLEQNVANLEAIAPEIFAKLSENLDRHHFKQMMKDSIKNHERILAYWTAFIMGRTYTPAIGYDPTINPGDDTPPVDFVKAFVRYIANCLRGTLEPDRQFVNGTLPGRPTRNTINRYIWSFLSLWPRYAATPWAPRDRLQVNAYLRSEEFDEVSSPLCTKMRPKAVADIIDANLLLKANRETDHYRTNHMADNMAYLIKLMLDAAERPSALVESAAHRGSNKALTHGNHEIFVTPDPDDPTTVRIALRVTIELLKGMRKDDAKYKQFLLYPEPDESRLTCPVTAYLTLAFRDNVFQDISTPEELFFPAHPCTRAHVLRIRPDKKDLLVFRREEVDDEGRAYISPDKAMNWEMLDRHLKILCRLAGYPSHLICYAFRTGTSNRWAILILDGDRRILQGHAENSDAFDKSYKCKTSMIDVQGISAERGQDPERVQLFFDSNRPSRVNDAKAPAQLTIQERAELLNEPELVALRDERAQVLAQIPPLRTRSREEANMEAELGLQIKKLSADAVKLRLEHDRIVEREGKLRFRQSRAEYFDGASARVLAGTAELPNGPAPMLARAKGALPSLSSDPVPGPSNSGPSLDQEPPPASDALAAPTVAASDPQREYLRLVLDGTRPRPTHEHLVECVNFLLSMHECRFKLTYPGEAPTAKNECPECGDPCGTSTMIRKSGGTGPHIHDCVSKKLNAWLRDAVEEAYQENNISLTCYWDGCLDSFATREEFARHVHRHIQHSTTDNFNYDCQWSLSETAICGESGILDWDVHFATTHEHNICTAPVVDYCFVANRWFPDLLGDKADWITHVEELYDELFLPFIARAGDIDVVPIGIEKVDDTIFYAHDTGFEKKQPEFHGYVSHGVALVPMFCPFCVYNDYIPVMARMKQYDSVDTWKRHLLRHLADLDEDDQHICPVPSCGTRTYSMYDFQLHLIQVHRLPICGIRKSVNVRILRLPTRDDETTETGSTSKKRARDTDDAVPRPEKKLKKDGNGSKDRNPGRCQGCHRKFNGDVTIHIQGSAPDSSCHKKAKYERIVNGQVEPGLHSVSFTTLDMEAARSNTKQRKRGCDQRCGGCHMQFKDIREHLPDGCPKNGTWFRVRNKPQDGQKLARSEVWLKARINFADWVRAQPSPEMVDSGGIEVDNAGQSSTHYAP